MGWLFFTLSTLWICDSEGERNHFAHKNLPPKDVNKSKWFVKSPVQEAHDSGGGDVGHIKIFLWSAASIV